jgi:tRNA G18 (ribose-2'-O)-methylase SpoU
MSQLDVPNPFTRRKFLSLDPKLRHKKCAELLRTYYEHFVKTKSIEWTYYNTLLQWMELPPQVVIDHKILADRYHYHLKNAHMSLKEHNLLPNIRTGDRTPKCEFQSIAIYLDHVRSAYNVGSIFRTTEALRIGHIHCSEKTPFIDNPKVIKTAMGSAEIVPCSQNTSLKNLPRPFIVMDTSDEAIALSQFIFPKSFTLILGNEEYGVSEELLKEADYLIEIPMFGAKNSLNIACAYAIAAAEIRRGLPIS